MLRFAVLLASLCLADLVSVSLGNIADFSEWMLLLDDGFVAECFGIGLLSLLLINPFLIEQLWRIFYFLSKAFFGLFQANRFLTFASPLITSVQQSAHGCRAPPSL